MNKQKLIGWVDHQWQTADVRYSLPLALLPSAVVVASLGTYPIPLAIATAWGGGWLALFGWRLVVFCRKGDRQFDRRIKFRLSREYWSTESATSAAKRRKRARP